MAVFAVRFRIVVNCWKRRNSSCVERRVPSICIIWTICAADVAVCATDVLLRLDTRFSISVKVSAVTSGNKLNPNKNPITPPPRFGEEGGRSWVTLRPVKASSPLIFSGVMGMALLRASWGLPWSGGVGCFGVFDVVLLCDVKRPVGNGGRPNVEACIVKIPFAD